MPRWVKAFGLIAVINSATELPPFVRGDWSAIVLRILFFALTYALAYTTVTGEGRGER